MDNSKRILNFNFTDVNFIYHSKNVFNQYMNNALEININKLKEIGYGDELMDLEINTQRITVLKFKKFATSNNTKENAFSNRELRTLCYSLSYSESSIESILSNDNELNIFLNLVDIAWKESFLKGLMYTYFVHFNDSHNTLLNLEKYIVDKIENYDGGNSFFIFFKKNKKYLYLKNGDITLGYELAIKNIKINEITFAINRPKSWISYSYFSGVIFGFYERNKIDITSFIDDLFIILKDHDSITTYKKIISKLIIQANESKYAEIQELVKLKSLEIVGDPSINTFWLPFENATDSEKNDLKNAQIILNEWLTKDFISIFFQECINDPRRKRFWLKYASKISSFKVYGPEQIKFLLKRNNTIGKFVDSRYSTTKSNKNISAFVFVMGDYKLIEFSDQGYAFIASKIDNAIPVFSTEKIQTVDDLRTKNYNSSLVNREGSLFYNLKDSGRLSHRDGDLSWEQTFAYWIKNKTNIDV